MEDCLFKDGIFTPFQDNEGFDPDMDVDPEYNNAEIHSQLQNYEDDCYENQLDDNEYDHKHEESKLDVLHQKELAQNLLFSKLFLEEDNDISLLNIKNEVEDEEYDVADFFGKGLKIHKQPLSSGQSGDNEQNIPLRSSTDNISNSSKEFENDDSTENYNHIHKSMSDAEKKEKKMNALNKHREKKRIKKMQQKLRKISTEDKISDDSKDSSEQSTKKESAEESDESVNPQKRKGTIWKILFPDKKSEKHGTELERLVCRQVEYQISKNPKVKKSYNELEKFENSEEGQTMNRSEFTKKKNRISAQLSRERREAILHSLINVCIENIKAKKELDSDIEEVKRVLKATICQECTSKLKNAS